MTLITNSEPLGKGWERIEESLSKELISHTQGLQQSEVDAVREAFSSNASTASGIACAVWITLDSTFYYSRLRSTVQLTLAPR